MDIPMIVWGAALVVFILVEAATAGLSSIWFALGALCALLGAIAHAPVWLQVVLFLAVSAVTLVLTRPLAKKYVNSRLQPTNADRCIGRQAMVIEDIDNLHGTGAVRLEGKDWTARSNDDTGIPAGETVIVTAIEGVKLLVSSVG